MKEDALAGLVFAIEKIRQGESYVSSLVLTPITEIFRQKLPQDKSGLTEPLTAREKEILQLVLEGKSSKEIAELLSVSIITIYNYRTNIKNKLRIRKNIDLFKYGVKHGYIQSYD